MERRRLISTKEEQYEFVEWIRCVGWCRITFDISDYSGSITSMDTEFKMKIYRNSSTSGMIAVCNGSAWALQVFTRNNSVYNQGASYYLGTSTIGVCSTYTTNTQKTLTVNGNYRTQTFSRAFANDTDKVYLFSFNETNYPSEDYFSYINLKINGNYIAKCKFVKRLSDSMILLYDELNDTLYENDGSGYFEQANI